VIAGITLIVLGVLALGYEEIPYASQDLARDVQPASAAARPIDLPPLLGALAMFGGVALLAAGARVSRRRSGAGHFTVTLLARLRGLSGSWPRSKAR